MRARSSKRSAASSPKLAPASTKNLNSRWRALDPFEVRNLMTGHLGAMIEVRELAEGHRHAKELAKRLPSVGHLGPNRPKTQKKNNLADLCRVPLL